MQSQAARQLEFLTGRRSAGPNTFSLGDALGTAQHHDAVSGTAKQHTTDDYAKRLAIGAAEVASAQTNLYLALLICFLTEFLAFTIFKFSQTETVVDSALSCLVSSNKNCSAQTVSFSQVMLQRSDFCCLICGLCI